MKKAFCLLLCILSLNLWAFAESDFSGEWYLIEMRYGDMTVPQAVLGCEVTLTLAADGSAKLTSTADDTTDSDAAVWIENDSGVLFAREDSNLQFTLEDGNLVADVTEDGDTVSSYMVFSREKPDSTLYTPAEETEVTDISEFNGVWTIHSIDLYGQIVPAEMYNYTETLTIQDGHVTVSSDMFSSDTVCEADGVLIAGQLACSITIDGEESELTLTLLSDGMLRDYEGTDEDLGSLYYYFEKTE